MASVQLNDLLPNKKYRIQIRAKNEFSQYSPWSEVVEFTTPTIDENATDPYDLVSLFRTQVGDLSQSSIGGLIKSANFDGTIGSNGNITIGSEGTTGWAIDAAGYAVFNNVLARGNIEASSGTVGGWTIGSTSIYNQVGLNKTTLSTITSDSATQYAFEISHNMSPSLSYPYAYLKIGQYYGTYTDQNWSTVSAALPWIAIGSRAASVNSERNLYVWSVTPDSRSDTYLAGAPSIEFDDLNGSTAGFIGSYVDKTLSLESNTGDSYVSVSYDDNTAISARGGYPVNTYNRLYTSHAFNQSAYHAELDYGSYSANALDIKLARTSSSSYDYISLYADYDATNDLVFKLRGDGRISTDYGSGVVTGGADYAEYFEWEDGNPNNEDRVGHVVVINSNKKIEKFNSNVHDVSKILGVVSANPAFIGNASDLNWQSKYLTDEWGRLLWEEYSIVQWYGEPLGINDTKRKLVSYHTDRIPDNVTIPEEHQVVTVDDNGNTLMRKVLNPEYNSELEYISRENRKEWAVIGLLGILRVRPDQYKPSNWVKIRDISSNVEEWFIK